MSDFAELMRQDRRLVVLRLLNEAPGYKASLSILHAALEQYGHAATRDQVRGDLSYLAEQGCLKIEDPDDIVIAEATSRGIDAALGRASVPGVKRPHPGG